MKMIQDLMEDHQLILAYLDRLEDVIGRPGGASQDALERGPAFVDFFRNFADQYHHATEEKLLFEFLVKPGVLTHCNPIPQMLSEHEAGREATRRMTEAIETENTQLFCNSAREFIQVLRDHIFKEDNILFPMAVQSLAGEDQDKLDSEAQLLQAELNASALIEKYRSALS